MGTLRKTRIIVPCYNESTRLNPKAFLSALESNANLYFLFVDDGSTDDTLNLLRYIKKLNPVQVEIMCLAKNYGKAEAVRQGVITTLNGFFDRVGYWDADLATPLDEIDRFCSLLDITNAQIVIGSRVRLLGKKIERRAMRHYLGRVFATCASILLDICIYDTQCGAKIFKNSDSLSRVFSKPFKVNWTFDVEILARFLIVENTSPSETSSQWVELPLGEWIDVKGSKVKFKDFIKCGLEICKLFYYFRTPAIKSYKKYLHAISGE